MIESMFRMIKNILFLSIFIIIIFCAGELSAHEEKGLILCSTTQIADFARNVVGDRFDVKSVLSPGADPHTYQPTPVDARLALEAVLCLQNGLHLEGKNWMAVLAKDAGKPLITCTEGIVPLIIKNEGRKINDPHAWFTPENATIYVKNILSAVIELDPGRESEYRLRAKLYLQQLRSLDIWIREQFNSIAPERRILVTSHDAFNYFAAEYGFKNSAPVGWSTGSEIGAGMTPERRIEVLESIDERNVKAIFVEMAVNPKLIREIAREAGVKIGGELYSDSMGEEGSAAYTYIGMMRENVITIITALR